MTTTTTTPAVRSRKSAKVRREHAATLQRRRDALRPDALTERALWERCKRAARFACRDASDAERDAIASETAERVLRRNGVHLADGWRVPRGLAHDSFLRLETRVTWRRSRTWQDVADGDAERIDRDGWSRTREDWIAPTHGVDAADLAERFAGRFPERQRETVRRFLIAASEAERDADGHVVYGPALAERLGCNLATLRKSVERGRGYVAGDAGMYPDPADLAAAIAEDVAVLADAADALDHWRPEHDPAGNRSVTVTASYAALNPPRTFKVAGRACAIPCHVSRTLAGNAHGEHVAQGSTGRAITPERTPARRDLAPMPERPAGPGRLDCSGVAYPAGLHWSGDTRRPGALWPDRMYGGNAAYSLAHPGRERERVAALAAASVTADD